MATTKVKELNRLIAAKGGQVAGTSVCDCVKKLAKRIDDVDVPATILTTAEALKYWADIVTGACLAKVSVLDSVTSDPVASPTVTIKTGAVIGSGDAITPTAGEYPLPEGSYNYSASASGYTTKTGTFAISEAQVITGSITIEIKLVEGA